MGVARTCTPACVAQDTALARAAAAVNDIQFNANALARLTPAAGPHPASLWGWRLCGPVVRPLNWNVHYYKIN